MVGEEASYQLLECICKRDSVRTLNLITQLSKKNLDYKAWIMDFRHFVVEATALAIGAESDTVLLSAETIEKIRQVATPWDLIMICECLCNLCDSLTTESDPLSRIRTVFMKMAVSY